VDRDVDRDLGPIDTSRRIVAFIRYITRPEAAAVWKAKRLSTGFDLTRL